MFLIYNGIIQMIVTETIEGHSFIENKAIYYCLGEAPLLTVIAGAKCFDGIVMVADRRFTDLIGGIPTFGMKILNF
jgi:hypothetical protein